MCRRRDSIAAMSAAADQLTDACERELRGGMAPLDPARPVHSGIARALKKSFRELGTTPEDMALQLKKIDRRG